MTASVRVLTASFKKIRLTCDFTVSGEISSPRAMRLLEQPWLIIARTSRSRAVSVSLTWLLGGAEWSPAERACHRDSRLATKGGTWRSFDPSASVIGIKAESFEAGLMDLSSHVSVAPPLPRTPPENAADLCLEHELHHAEPPSNRSSIERNLMQICVSARAPAKLVAPPSMRHHAKTFATTIADLMLADLRLCHDTVPLRLR
jgi:hypothetical protein